MCPKTNLNFKSDNNRLHNPQIILYLDILSLFTFIHVALDVLRRVCRQRSQLPVTIQTSEDRRVLIPGWFARCKEPNFQLFLGLL